MLLRTAAIWTLIVLSGAVVAAHPVPFSYLDVHLSGTRVDASVVIHVFDLGHDLNVSPPERLLDRSVIAERAAAAANLLAPRLSLVVDGQKLSDRWGDPEILTERQSIRFHLSDDLGRVPATVVIQGTLFPYDSQHQTFINVYDGEALTQAIIDGRHDRFEYFAGTRQGVAAVIEKFVPSGIHHILIGPDHILFLLGLLLMGGSLKRLAVIVTGFTLAHSLTLSLAALNLVTPPARLIEPAIALSIVVVGADNLLVGGGSARDFRALIAFGFGFIHGFGFANVLREMSLPSRALGWSLLSFNVGVELGQLAIVLIAATALAVLRRARPGWMRPVIVSGSVVVMAAGAFWFFQRLLFPGGS